MRHMLARHRALSFEWGVSDCSMFAEVVTVMTGFNPAAGVRRYASALTARTALQALGYRSVLELVIANFDEIPPSRAQRGDLGFTGDVMALTSPAVIDGAMAHSKGEQGYVSVPRGHLLRAFAV